MIDKLYSILKEETGIGHLSQILSGIGDLLELLEKDYMVDQDLKNAVIDSICEIIKSHKDPITP